MVESFYVKKDLFFVGGKRLVGVIGQYKVMTRKKYERYTKILRYFSSVHFRS